MFEVPVAFISIISFFRELLKDINADVFSFSDGNGDSNDGEIISCDQPEGYVPNNNDNVSYPDGYGSCCRGDDAVGVDELEDVVFNLYPNPTTSWLNLEYNSSYASDVEVQIFNSIGELAFMKSYSFTHELNTSLNVSGYAKGLYQVRLLFGGYAINKLVVIH